MAAVVAATIGSAHAADPLLVEDFDVVASLRGEDWRFTNISPAPDPFQEWTQGNPGVFTAQSGAPSSYAAASFLSSASPEGAISNWIITSTLELSGGEVVSFWLRSEAVDGVDFFDRVVVRLSPLGSASPSGFSTLLLDVADVPTVWTQYSVSIPTFSSPASVRVGFEYNVSSAVDASYVGLDTLTINPIPEPTAAVLLALGLAGIALRRRLMPAVEQTT